MVHCLYKLFSKQQVIATLILFSLHDQRFIHWLMNPRKKTISDKKMFSCKFIRDASNSFAFKNLSYFCYIVYMKISDGSESQNIYYASINYIPERKVNRIMLKWLTLGDLINVDANKLKQIKVDFHALVSKAIQIV